MARLQDFQTVTPTSSDKLLVVQSQGQGLVPYGSKLDSENPTGTGSLSLNRASGSTVGAYSVAEGLNCTASGLISHAEGQGTIANHLCQHVFGRYNIADTSTAAATAQGNYIEIVGKGATDGTRSNARTLDWNGNEVLAGDLTINGNVNLSLKTYGATNNGVTYNLFMMGCMGILTIKTGTLTNAVNANTALVTLTDFSNDFTGKKFSSSFQFVSTTDTTKRFDCANGENTLICPVNLSAGFAPRGCVPVIIQ